MTVSFELMVLLTVPAASVLLVFFVCWQHKLQRRQWQQLQQQSEQLSRQLQSVSTELEELRAGLIGIGQRVLQAEQQQQQLSAIQHELAAEQQNIAEQQQKIDMFDPDSKLYSRAMKMVQLGAPLEEVMRECELPRAEAELLYNLHKNS